MPLPSLRSLQVFEAAARSPTLRAAADVLFLTHGAVSRQIRSLEAELGVALFIRSKQGMRLTPQGRKLQQTVAAALMQIQETASHLESESTLAASRVAVTVLPALHSRWLCARLPKFQSLHPGIAIDVIPTMAPLDLAEKNIQIGIRYGAGKWAGLISEKLATENLFPVFAAAGIAGYDKPPLTARDLLQYPLLNPYDDWQRWFVRAETMAQLSVAGKTFNDASELLRAAELGEGVALGRQWLVTDALDDGRLVRLAGPSIASARAYYLVYPQNHPPTAGTKIFSDWLRGEMGDLISEPNA